MARVEFDIETTVPPARVLAALTDFTDRRPEIWPGLKREMYKVYEVGDTWADVREGNSPSIWARERYDWSVAGTVTWTVEKSSFCTPGSFPGCPRSQLAREGSTGARGAVGRQTFGE